ncbi:SH3 domain-containing protein [Cohnella algarum]|uniref:SH3 domain-containing protein n=1 Tax=Cohnella algarum TaxID=2044859 RepID=UPI001967387E|nr:SH3 domain-containing protein [Cohnella algarum]MBN2981783.1 SH3 domain-containing protein [Cohnella algarum]
MKKKVILFAALLLSVPAVGSVSAASNYETEVEWGVNFRTAPSTSSKVIRMLPKGEDVHVIEKVNSYWLKIETKDGKTGYISADPKYTNYSGSPDPSSSAPTSEPKPKIINSPSSSKADAIIATAKSLIGKAEYDYGTRDRNRLIFDCSSFTEYVFEKNGIELKWGTKYQKDAGTYVSKSKLQKGCTSPI